MVERNYFEVRRELIWRKAADCYGVFCEKLYIARIEVVEKRLTYGVFSERLYIASAFLLYILDKNRQHTVISLNILLLKGASLLRMMNHFLTEPTFKQGITNYLNNK